MKTTVHVSYEDNCTCKLCMYTHSQCAQRTPLAILLCAHGYACTHNKPTNGCLQNEHTWTFGVIYVNICFDDLFCLVSCPDAGEETSGNVCAPCKQGYYAENGDQRCKPCNETLTEGLQKWDTVGEGSTGPSDCSIGKCWRLSAYTPVLCALKKPGLCLAIQIWVEA